MKKWYAAYTMASFEKKVANQLRRKGLEHYLPVKSASHEDARKGRHEVLFPKYVFVRMAENQVGQVKSIAGVLSFLYWRDQLAVFKDTEIEMMQGFLEKHPVVKTEKSSLYANGEATVSNAEDEFNTQKEGNVAKLFLPSLKCTLVSLTQRSKLKVIREKLYDGKEAIPIFTQLAGS